MGRREQRAELQSTWTALEPRVAGVPMTKKDMEDGEEPLSARDVLALLALSDHGAIRLSRPEWEVFGSSLEVLARRDLRPIRYDSGRELLIEGR